MLWRTYGSAVLGVLLAVSPVAGQSGKTTTNPNADSASTIIQQLLDAGLKSDPQSFENAEKLWRSNRLAARRDARVDYAWGLVLRKHGRNREAERQFLTAAGRTKPKYLPARQAVVWMKLATGDTKGGLLQLEALLRDVASAKDVSDAERAEAAEFIGSVLAALKKVTLSKRDASKFELIRRKAERMLKGKLAEAVKRGEEAVAKKSKQLEAAALKRRLLARGQEAKRTEKQNKTLAKKKSVAAAQEKTLKRSAEQWDEWLETREKAAKVLLNKHMKEFQILEGRRQSLTRSMLLTSQEWSRRKTSFEQGLQGLDARDPRRAFLVNSANQVLGRLELEYGGYQQQYLATMASMFAVRKAAFAVIAQYRRDVKIYETATGNLARRGKALDKWQDELKRAEVRLKNQNVGGALAKKVAASQNHRVSSYLEFDIEQERKRLLASLGKSAGTR